MPMRIDLGRGRERADHHRHVVAAALGVDHVGEQERAALVLRHAAEELPAHQRMQLGVLVDRRGRCGRADLSPQDRPNDPENPDAGRRAVEGGARRQADRAFGLRVPSDVFAPSLSRSIPCAIGPVPLDPWPLDPSRQMHYPLCLTLRASPGASNIMSKWTHGRTNNTNHRRSRSHPDRRDDPAVAQRGAESGTEAFRHRRSIRHARRRRKRVPAFPARRLGPGTPPAGHGRVQGRRAGAVGLSADLRLCAAAGAGGGVRPDPERAARQAGQGSP